MRRHFKPKTMPYIGNPSEIAQGQGSPQKKGGFGQFLGDLASAIPYIGPIVGNMIQRGQSKRDIREQNEYNSPINQLNRLREAGLPYAAFSGGQSGQQSALPTSNDMGLNNLSNYFVNQMQLEQMKLVKANIRKENAIADREEATSQVLLSGVGQTIKPTYLSEGIVADTRAKQQTVEGQKIANTIQQRVSENQSWLINEQNRMLTAQVENALADLGLKATQQQIQTVIAATQEKRSDAELNKILADIGLTEASTEGRNLDNKLAEIRNMVEDATKDEKIQIAEKEAYIKAIQSQEVERLFKNNKDYQYFVDKVREYLKNPDPSWKERVDAYISMIYTTGAGITGNSPGFGNILQGLD